MLLLRFLAITFLLEAECSISDVALAKLPVRWPPLGCK